MSKRKPLMYFTIVIALLGMFVATKAVAQYECPAPDSCTAGGYILEAVRGESDEFPVKTTCYDSTGTNSWTCYKYEYDYLQGEISKIDHVYFAIPYNCFDPITVFDDVYWGDPRINYHVDYYAPCEGGGNVSFAEFVCSVRVIRISPQGNKVVFFAATDRNGSGSHYISAGKNKYGCVTPIIAPGYNPEAPIGGRTFTECANFGQETQNDPNDDVSFYMVRRSDEEGCITRLWKCLGHNCPGCGNQVCPSDDACEEVTPEGLPDDYILQGSFLRACPDENISVDLHTGSRYYLYKFYSGGVLYKMCLNTLTGKWVDISYCK